MILHVKTLFIWLALFGLVACGGGGSVSREDSAGGGTGTDPDPVTISLQLAFTDASGQPSTELSESNPLTLTTTVTDSNGNPVTNTLVTFSFQPEGLAVFGNDAGTASTNSNGVATIDILVGENSGAGQITATLSSGETATTTFNSAGIVQIGEQPASLELFGSSTQLASSGSDEIELIALAKDANNVLLEGIDVTFSANAGASIQVTQGTTGPDGIAKAVLSTQNNAENREIIVTARTGTFAPILKVAVVGTSISVNGPPSVILGSQAELTVFLSDSDGKGIANKAVELTSSSANTFSLPAGTDSFSTDGEGQLTVLYSADNSGQDVIVASSLGENGSFNISVQQDQFNFSTVTDDDIPINQASELELTWLQDNTPLVNGEITLTTTRGQLSTTSVNTDTQGKASFQISSTNAGKAVISAQGKDANGNLVNARAKVEFIAVDVDNIVMSASPNSIGPAGQKSAITAVLRDDKGNLVKGKTVNFNADDVSGGEISPASAVTDSNGLATTVYTSNNVTTENGITITATEPESGVNKSVELTVADRAQFISIGTGNTIESPNEASYLKKFTVFVTDANSNPVKNVELTVTGTPVKFDELLDPNAQEGEPNYKVIRPAFYKGYWTQYPNADEFKYWIAVPTHGCKNEDKDGDGIEDENEDVNRDGALTPGNIVSITGNVVTDENGQAIIELRYAKTFAAWTQIKITASTQVSGSESQTSQFYTLAASGEDLTIESTPPNANPFGTGLNSVENPDEPGTFYDDGANLTCENIL